MKNFTGKVTNVDNNGNPIKKKSTGKNGKKSGFKKPAAVKKSSGKKPLKDITAVMTKKPVRKIVEYYYFFDEEMYALSDFLIMVFVMVSDQQWFEERGIKTKYQISYDTGDIEAVREVLHNIMAALGGRICSDTDDFEPSCTADTLDKLI